MFMDLSVQGYLMRQPTVKLRRVLVEGHGMLPEQRNMIVRMLRRRRKMRRKYPRRKLRALQTSQLDEILNTLIINDDIVLIEPVVKDILAILRHRAGY